MQLLKVMDREIKDVFKGNFEELRPRATLFWFLNNTVVGIRHRAWT